MNNADVVVINNNEKEYVDILLDTKSLAAIIMFNCDGASGKF